MIGYIYMLRCPSDNSIKYIGLTKNPYKRKKSHRSYTNENRNWKYNLWKKYLKSINERAIFEIIEQVSVDMMSNREIYWIQYYKTLGIDLLNLTSGGEWNMMSENHNSIALKGKSLEDYYTKERSDEIREKISKGISGENNPNFGGKHCTEEWSKNQSKSQSKVPILIYEEDQLIGEFQNSKEAALFLKVSTSSIRECKRSGWLVKRKYKVINKPQ